LEDIAFKNIPSRLASLLLRIAEEQGTESRVSGYTHQDLGEMLGTYRETITQTLNDFKAEGLVEISRKQVLLLDLDKLEFLAES